MSRRLILGLMLGLLTVAATARAQSADGVTANAGRFIPAENPTSAPATPAEDGLPAAEAPADDAVADASTADEPATAAATDDIESRGVPPRDIDQRPIKQASRDTTTTGWWWRTLAAMALVVALIFLVRHALARYAGGRTGGGGQGVVEVLSRTPVGARQSVMLLRIGPRVLVVGAGGETMTTLTEIDDPEQVSQLLGAVERARAGSLSGAFAGALKREQGAWPDDDDPATAPSQTTSPVSGAVDQMKAMLGRLRGGSGAGRRR